jgi:aminoglycoside phosphotransferase family enzyme/predicted kinase
MRAAVMDLPQLIEALSRPDAYPDRVATVEVLHTHISVVFVAGEYVYKLKKPVNLGFLDFSTLDKRRHFCEEEVRLNRRLAPTVYLGVVPVTRAGDGLRLEGNGEVIEWAVKMRRLPEEATLQQRLRRDEVSVEQVEALARRLAAFHAAAGSGEHVSSFGRFEVVAGNARENFEQSANQAGVALSRAVFERLQALTEAALERLHPLIDGRAGRGVPRDTHGDLHLDHVYFFPDQPPPDDLVIIDCIEFNERFRFADPVADMAFVDMDLEFHGRRELARVFREAYFHASGDDEGRALLPFYKAYRAAVRGKVEGMELAEQEVPGEVRARALAKARAHWLLALGELEEPGRRPCLVLVGGLPGAGKSTLAHGLAERAGFTVIRSDMVRKEIAADPNLAEKPGSAAEGIYSSEWTEGTYAECRRRCEVLLFEGQRVIVDASFRQEKHRRAFLEAALRWGVPAVFLLCQADADIVRQRLEQRRGDASDADLAVHVQLAGSWDEPGPATRRLLHTLDTGDIPEHSLAKAMAMLRDSGLLS